MTRSGTWGQLADDVESPSASDGAPYKQLVAQRQQQQRQPKNEDPEN
jgi:hypothetical protein